jgi:tripeptide aminopeptidase
LPTETGNLIVDLPGKGALHNQPRLMFMTHMDTVPLCAGAKPKRQGRRMVNTVKPRWAATTATVVRFW